MREEAQGVALRFATQQSSQPMHAKLPSPIRLSQGKPLREGMGMVHATPCGKAPAQQGFDMQRKATLGGLQGLPSWFVSWEVSPVGSCSYRCTLALTCVASLLQVASNTTNRELQPCLCGLAHGLLSRSLSFASAAHLEQLQASPCISRGNE